MKAYYEKRSYPADLPLRIYRHEQKSFSFHAHWHSDVEVVIVREGSLRFGINREIRTLQQGDIAVCCSGDIHFYDSTGLVSTIDILIFRPELIGCHGSWPADIRFRQAFITRSELEEYGVGGSLTEQVEQLFQTIADELDQRRPYYSMFVTAKIMELCGLLQRLLPSSLIDPKKENKRIASLQTVQEIIRFLEDHYREPLTLADAAGHVNMSPYHFCRIFQSLVGTNFKTFLNAIRADMAEEQILHTDRPITVIALECGFNNLRTFNRVFKSVKGYTPSSLRMPEEEAE